MVQKSKILGKSSIIFVTIGTTNFKFDRLFKTIDKVLTDLNFKSKLIVQVGESDYKWHYKNITVHKYISPILMNRYLLKADRIITHGGFGSLFLISKKAKIMPLVIPRLKKFGEHIDNHQRDFVNFIRKKFPSNLKRYFVIEELIEKQILDYLTKKPAVNYLKKNFSERNKNLIFKKLSFYIENIDKK